VVAPRDTCADLAAFAFDVTFCHANLCVARRATAP
jgi:hypothetical protein